jgi:hypothetical protein
MEGNKLVFFGNIAASVTHDIKNVLAAINESNGLMADFLEMSRETPFEYREKFQRSIRRIEEQVRRGVEITSAFNRFAHSVDRPCVNIDLNEIVALTVSLSARFARLRNVELKAAVCDRPVMLVAGAFQVQMALTGAIEAFVACMGAGGSIVLSTKEDLSQPSLHFYFHGEPGEKTLQKAVVESSEWRRFEELASVLDIRYEWLAPGGGLALFFCGAPAMGQM